MEFFAYLILLGVALLFAFEREMIRSDRLFFFVYILIYSALSLIVRLKFDGDIEDYAQSMSYDSLSLYFLREPVVWFGQRWLYSILKSEYLVFFVCDFIMGIILYKSLRNVRAPQYIFFSVLAFFPFLLGMQNVYRQWVACLIFMLAISIQDGRLVISAPLYLLSVLSHNVAGAFLLIFTLKQKIIFRRLILILVSILTPLILLFGSGTKSEAATGDDLTIPYLVLLCVIGIFFVLADRLIIRWNVFEDYEFIILLLYITLCSVIFLASAGAERVAMFSLILLYPAIGRKIEERFKYKIVLRMSLVILGFVPILFFGTSKFIL